MPWWTNFSHKVSALLQTDAVNAIVNYSSKTIGYVYKQIGVLPAVTQSIQSHSSTHTLFNHLLRISVEDLIPLVAVTYTNQLLQEHGQAYLEEEPNDALLSTNTLLQTSLFLLQTAIWVYSIRKKTQMLFRTAIVTIEIPSMINNIEQHSVCQNCSVLRFIQGSLRDNAAYFATEASLSLLGYVPVIGSYLAEPLLAYHRGRYILTVVLRDLCNRHQVVYLSENSELAMSLGLLYWATLYTVNYGIERVTGIPSDYYKGFIAQLLLIFPILIATHMNLPQPQNESSRKTIDPIFYFQFSVGFMVDIILLGLKIKIPRMLTGKQPGNFKETIQNLPWQRMHEIENLLHHNKIAYLLLPNLLHNKDYFMQDPLVDYHLPHLKIKAIELIKMIEKISEEPAIRAASTAPDAACLIIQVVFGTPRYLTKLLLQLLSDHEVIEGLRQTRYKLEPFELYKQPLMPTITPVKEPTIVPIEELPAYAASSTAIEKERPADEIIKKRKLSLSLFHNPDAIIRRQPRKNLADGEENNGHFMRSAYS